MRGGIAHGIIQGDAEKLGPHRLGRLRHVATHEVIALTKMLPVGTECAPRFSCQIRKIAKNSRAS